MSQYGTPPLKIETPEVLERTNLKDKNIQQFSVGTFESPYTLLLNRILFKVNSKRIPGHSSNIFKLHVWVLN